MADYVTEEQVTAFSHEFGALSDSGAVTTLLTAASRFFDNQCEVPENFFAEAADPASYAARDFIGNGTAYLQIDPYTVLNPTDPVMLNNGTVADPDYTTANVPDYITKDGALVVLDRTGNQGFTTDGRNRFVGWPEAQQIRISANWGFSAIPADVVLACAHIAIHLWRTADPAFALISNAEGAATRIETIPKIARDIVTKYREKYSRRAIFV